MAWTPAGEPVVMRATLSLGRRNSSTTRRSASLTDCRLPGAMCRSSTRIAICRPATGASSSSGAVAPFAGGSAVALASAAPPFPTNAKCVSRCGLPSSRSSKSSRERSRIGFPLASVTTASSRTISALAPGTACCESAEPWPPAIATLRATTTLRVPMRFLPPPDQAPYFIVEPSRARDGSLVHSDTPALPCQGVCPTESAPPPDQG